MALAVSRAAAAQTVNCSSAKSDTAVATGSKWAPPLDRLVTAHAAEVSLRDALDRVAATAKLRVSYSAELLPLTREVCLSADGKPAGKVLDELLAGTNVGAVGLGGDQVVLAPHREPAAQKAPDPQMATSLGVLDRVVVTGAATEAGNPERELAVGLTVIDGKQLSRDNTSTLSGTLDSYVPGVWGWAQSPSSMISSYASIRGASSFGLSYPKVYIDGIEVANPLLLSRFNADAIDRIEVIRGPQGSALYGADAISGVVNIVTRHEGAPLDGSHAAVRTTAGFSQSSYGGGVLAQDHSLAIATGTSTRSADLHVSGGSIGSFIPDGYSRDLMASGSARRVGQSSTLSATARLFVERAGTPDSPLVKRPASIGDTSTAASNASPQAVTQYTVGLTGTRAFENQWTLSLVGGVDGYRLTNVQSNVSPIPTVLDSALRAAEGGADRGTLRASGVYQINPGAATHATVTFEAEHATLRVSTVPVTSTSAQAPPPPPPASHRYSNRSAASATQTTASTDPVTSWQNSTGFLAQTNVAVNDFLFATGGVRFEHDSRLSDADLFETLPMVGLSAVKENGPFTVKLRGAYGKGIRPTSTPSRIQLWRTQDGRVSTNELGPERQSGIEGGVDFLVRQALSLQITRFDQRASGLIQLVGVAGDSAIRTKRMEYVAQNVGEITNRGWEFQGTGNIARLSVSGTLSFVDSRVVKLAKGYSGDLVKGDRMLQVPAWTQSVNVGWTADKWHLSVGGSRALDWINYDELKLAQAVAASGAAARDFTGMRLRQYWARYDGATRLRATATRDVRDLFSVEISGDNLLNHQTGEPDNITVIPGRTIMTGVRVRF